MTIGWLMTVAIIILHIALSDVLCYIMGKDIPDTILFIRIGAALSLAVCWILSNYVGYVFWECPVLYTCCFLEVWLFCKTH